MFKKLSRLLPFWPTLLYNCFNSLRSMGTALLRSCHNLELYWVITTLWFYSFFSHFFCRFVAMRGIIVAWPSFGPDLAVGRTASHLTLEYLGNSRDFMVNYEMPTSCGCKRNHHLSSTVLAMRCFVLLCWCCGSGPNMCTLVLSVQRMLFPKFRSLNMLGHPLVGKLGTFLNLTLVKNLSYFRIMDLKCTNIYW